MVLDEEIEAIAKTVIDCAFRTHVDLGPGLLESVYEAVLHSRFQRLYLSVERQKPVSIVVDGLTLPNAFKVDLFVEEKLLVELNRLNS